MKTFKEFCESADTEKPKPRWVTSKKNTLCPGWIPNESGIGRSHCRLLLGHKGECSKMRK